MKFTAKGAEIVGWIQKVAETRNDKLHKEVVRNCTHLILKGHITNEKLNKILQVAFMYWIHVSKATKPEDQATSKTYEQAMMIYNWATDWDLKRRVQIRRESGKSGI